MVDRTPEEIGRLRWEAHEAATVCADCFNPLTPKASVTMVERNVYNPDAMFPNLMRRVPICLSCSLVTYPRKRPVRKNGKPGTRSAPGTECEYHRQAVQGRGLTAVLDGKFRTMKVFRCEGCKRPMRLFAYSNNIPRTQSTCCEKCRKVVALRRDRERKRVTHDWVACTVCGYDFMPKRTDATTCSNKCRQRAFRQRRADELTP